MVLKLEHYQDEWPIRNVYLYVKGQNREGWYGTDENGQ